MLYLYDQVYDTSTRTQRHLMAFWNFKSLFGMFLFGNVGAIFCMGTKRIASNFNTKHKNAHFLYTTLKEIQFHVMTVRVRH